MRPWNKFASLPWRDRLRLVYYSGVLLLISLALHLFGFHKVYHWLAAHPYINHSQYRYDTAALRESKQIAYLVSAASRYGLNHATCLQQSLFIWWSARQRGIRTELRIGVQKQGGQIFAHAWVRLGDEVISEGAFAEKNFAAFEGLTLE